MFSKADLGDRLQKNPLVKKILWHSTLPGEKHSTLPGEKGEKPDVVVEVQPEIVAEHGLGVHLRKSQAREFLKELSFQIWQQHRLLGFHFLVCAEEKGLVFPLAPLLPRIHRRRRRKIPRRKRKRFQPKSDDKSDDESDY